MAKTWVLYVTFARDLDWTRYSLESFRKYATGFAGVMIVVPTQDVDKFKQFERYSTPDCPVVIKGFLEYPGRGFVHHLAMKCYADVLCPEADYILHMDPDCLFSAQVTPYDYFHKHTYKNVACGNGGIDIDTYKPVLVIEPYEALKTTHPARYNWKQVTEKALRFEVTHETMCRHPAVHNEELYAALRQHIEIEHRTPFMDFVLKQENKYPQGFGEFNTLGAYAMISMPDRYHFIDRGDQGDKNDPPSKVTQLWSYTGTIKNLDQIKKILA